MHPYTRSLLSSIPQPDPDYEKGRELIIIQDNMIIALISRLREIAPGHLVYANEAEFIKLKKNMLENLRN